MALEEKSPWRNLLFIETKQTKSLCLCLRGVFGPFTWVGWKSGNPQFKSSPLCHFVTNQSTFDPPWPRIASQHYRKKYRKTILINIWNIDILQKLIYPIFWDHLIELDPPPPGHLDNVQEVHLFSFQLSCQPVTQDVTCPHPQAPNKQILDPAPSTPARSQFSWCSKPGGRWPSCQARAAAGALHIVLHVLRTSSHSLSNSQLDRCNDKGRRKPSGCCSIG